MFPYIQIHINVIINIEWKNHDKPMGNSPKKIDLSTSSAEWRKVQWFWCHVVPYFQRNPHLAIPFRPSALGEFETGIG
jgi:hypothetical protein